MPNSEAYNLLLRDIRQFLAEEKVYHENEIREHEDRIRKMRDLDRRLAVVRLGEQQLKGDADNSSAQGLAIANGRSLASERADKVDKSRFDVILNLTSNTLRFRQDPSKHTRLDISPLKDIGAHRMRILIYMLQHPGWRISDDNVSACYGTPDEVRTTSALHQTIRVLRRALGTRGRANPYIRSVPDCGPASRRNGCVYLMEPRWKYLVIT